MPKLNIPMEIVRLEQLQVNLAEEVVRALAEQVLSGLSLDQTIRSMARRFTECFEYPLIWIGTKEPDGSLKVRALGGEFGDHVENDREYWKGAFKKQGAVSRAMQNNTTQDLYQNDLPQLGSDRLVQGLGIQSGVAIPLAVRNRVLGVFNVYAYQGPTFEPGVLRCLERFADQLGLGLMLARDYDYLRLQGTAVSSAEHAVCIANPDGCIEWVNEAYCRLTGYGAGEVMGTTLTLFPTEGEGSGLTYRKAPLKPGGFGRSELEKTHKDGRVYTVEQTLTPLLDTRGRVKNFVSVLQDVTARKDLEAQMDYRAHHDPLTDLPNRFMFQDRLNQALAWALRHGGLVSVLFLDLDRFKQMNDEFGHGTGDKILQTVAARLTRCVRATDTVARLSGDEFTVILPDVRRVRDVYRVAQKILDCLKQRFVLDGRALFTKASMGIALYPRDGTDPDALLQRADRAMYYAKSLGGQCCWFASEELNLQFALKPVDGTKPGIP